VPVETSATASLPVGGGEPQTGQDNGAPQTGSVAAPIRAASPATTPEPGMPTAATPGIPAAAAAPTAVPGAGTGRRPPTPRPDIVVGNVSVLTGPVGAAVVNGVRAVQAWAAGVNSRGGLAGARIRLSVADDGSDPARHRALVQQMVEKEGAVAFVHNAAPLSGQGAVAYLQQRRIPVIGSETGGFWVNENSMYFPQAATNEFLAHVGAGGLAQVALAEHRPKLAIFFCEFATCRIASTTRSFQDFGMEVVAERTVSVTAPDYLAECLAARNAGAQTVFVQLDAASVRRLVQSCAGIGFQPLYGFLAQTSLSPALADVPELEGAVFSAPVAPFFAGLPAMEELRATMARHAPGAVVDVQSVLGWTSARLFERAVAGVAGDAPVSSSQILEALWSIRGDDLGGLTYPLTYEPAREDNAGHERSCWWVIRLHRKTWTSPDGNRRHCWDARS
jgi:branched-chain amino acid transport system substrate-binding protein